MNTFKVGVASLVLIVSTASYADQYVHGYTRSNGTYVEPYHRTDRDGNSEDNYSTKGNTNPYTGERGEKNIDPYGSSSTGDGWGSRSESRNNYGGGF